MSPADQATVLIDGHQVRLSSLDKVIYPESGTTKGEILHYYVSIAPVLLPQLALRPVTRVRWPDGTAGPSFFEKNLPAGAPDWVSSVVLPAPGSQRDAETVRYPLVDDLATLVWLANLAALELHVPQWRLAPAYPTPSTSPITPAGRAANATAPTATQPLAAPPDRLVIDLDPGPPAGLAECARVALLVRPALIARGYRAIVPVTSGSKGLQLYARRAWVEAGEPNEVGSTADDAREVATELAREHPNLVLAQMKRSLRPGKVFLDWSQNHPVKTTICPYSLRGKNPLPWAAAPRRWDEIEAGANGGPLTQLQYAEVLRRVERDGDFMAALDDVDTERKPRRRGAQK